MSISTKDIMSCTNKGLDIFKHYLGEKFVNTRKSFRSPFYNDTKASCNIFLDKKSNLFKFKDFGENEPPIDGIGFACKYLNLNCQSSTDFVFVLNSINKDLSLGLDNKTYASPKRNHIQTVDKTSAIKLIANDEELNSNVTFKNFSQQELDYWYSYGVDSKLLRTFNVKSVKFFKGISQSGNSFTLTSNDKEPMFAYAFQNFIKLYRPNSKLRFLYNGKINNPYIFGYEQMPNKGDLLFITGGEKDVLSLCSKGFNSICFNSETANIPDVSISKLSTRFKHIIILYDCDKTGIKSMNELIVKHKHFKVKRLILPLTGNKDDKDVSDYFKKGYTRENLIELFYKELEQRYAVSLGMLKACEVDINLPPKKKPALLQINNISIGSPGNIVGITGTEGSGKSNFIGGIIAGCLAESNSDVDTLGIDVLKNTKSKAVLIYDTEQSEFQLYKNTINTFKRSNTSKIPDWYKSFSIVSLSRKERLTAIYESIDKYYYEFGGIHLIVIDGVADLISSVNDEEQSVSLIDHLFKIAGLYNTLIICVLHLNPSGLKLRGHLGSELQRKASGILSIEKKKDNAISTVKAIKLREGNPLDVPQIQFVWDNEKDRHVFYGYLELKNNFDFKLQNLRTLAEKSFKTQSQISTEELTSIVMENYDVKNRMARNYIKLMRDNGIIKKSFHEQNSYIMSQKTE